MAAGFLKSPEQIIMLGSVVVTLGLLLFAVDWRYFRDWVVVYLFKMSIGLILTSAVVEAGLIAYPVRYFPQYFDTGILFEALVFPTLCVLYNQVVRARGAGAAIFYALLFSAGIAFIEYPIELYTGLIEYINWSWYASLLSIFSLFLVSRVFIAFYRWGCGYFGSRLY